MGKPINYPKPDLSRLANRSIQFSTNRNDVEMQLLGWVSEIVYQTKQRPEGGFKPETYLMASAKDSIDVLMQALPAASMQLPARNSGGNSARNKPLVHADFHWLRRPDGHWIVDAVVFAVHASAAADQLARQRAVRLKLQEKAEDRAESRIDLRKVAFPIENMPLEKFSQEIQFGDDLLEYAIERAHENAKEDAAMLENPVTPVDMALDMGHLGVNAVMPAGRAVKGAKDLEGTLAKEYHTLLTNSPVAREAAHAAHVAHQTHQLHKTYEIAHGAHTALEAGEVAHEHEKSTGDKALEIGLDVASVFSPYVKTLAGMMFEIAIASDAARVTKLRSRCYVLFVAGYIGQLTLTDTGRPRRALDQKYFDLGVKIAPKPGTPGSMRTQLALLHYASEHYTDGGWRGLGYTKEHWHFPDQYIVKWSPALLGRSFATRLHKRKYLIE